MPIYGFAVKMITFVGGKQVENSCTVFADKPKLSASKNSLFTTSKIMFRPSVVLILLCLFAGCAYSQAENYDAPVKWERYKVGEREVSVSFPKLPVVIKNFGVCSEQISSTNAAYADGVVYGLNITYKSVEKIPAYCTNKVVFGEQSFRNRVEEIKSQINTAAEEKARFNNRDAVKIKGNLFTYWLINDFDNKRWFELWISEENDAAPTIKNFVESFKIEKDPAGIEIGKGSNRTLGDAQVTTENIAVTNDAKSAKTVIEKTEPMRLILKPRANYTDAARQNTLQGTVRLRVNFLSSGGVGNIAPISELPFGLTQEAVNAASKIVFIPANKSGINVSVSRIVEYSFTIY